MVEWWCNDEKRSRTAKLEEYERARETISIADHWMHSSSNAGLIRKLEDDARQHNGMADSFERTALDAIRYAWSLDSDQKARALSTDVPSVANGNMYNGALQMHNALSSHDKKLVHLSLSTLTRRKVDSFELQLVIGYMRRGADECNARKKWVVGQMINVVARADSEADSAGEASAVVKAHDLLVAALWKEIDDLKELAIETVFITPTIRYFEEVGDSIMAGDTDVHGANTYLGLLMATLGIRLNRLPLFHDEEVKGVAPFLDAKGPFVEKWLPALWDRSVLGHKPASSVRATVQARVARNAFYFSGSHPFEVANNAIDRSERSRPARQRFAAYLEQYASYFNESFVVERLLNTVLAEDRLCNLADVIVSAAFPDRNGATPPQVGDSSALQTVEHAFRDFIWPMDDDCMPQFQMANATAFLQHLRVLKPAPDDPAGEAEPR